MADLSTLAALLDAQERTKARVINAAIDAVSFWEARMFEEGHALLKAAVEAHQAAHRAYFYALTGKEKTHGDQHAAA